MHFLPRIPAAWIRRYNGTTEPRLKFPDRPRRREAAGKKSEQITASKRLFAEAVERAFCCGKRNAGNDRFF
jgi:hypothetical protein